MGFTRISDRSYDSSIWLHPDPAYWKVWHGILARCDRKGALPATAHSLAAFCALPLQKVEEVLGYLSSPDPSSRDTSNDGRRITVGPSGIRVLNRTKYLSDSDRRAEYQRVYMQRYRESRKPVKAEAPAVVDVPAYTAPPPPPLPTPREPDPPPAPAPTEPEKQKPQPKPRREKAPKVFGFTAPTPAEVDAEIKRRGYKGLQFDGEGFCAYYDARNWTLRGGIKISSWKACLTTFYKNELQRKVEKSPPKQQELALYRREECDDDEF